MSTQTMKSKMSTKPAGEPPPVAGEDVVDRLAGLLPADELQDALRAWSLRRSRAPAAFSAGWRAV